MINAFRFSAIAIFLLAAHAVPASAWVGGRGPGNRNAFPQATFPSSPAVVWKSYLGAGYVDVMPSNTLVAAGNVIVAYGRHLLAVSTETGEGRWVWGLPEAPVGDLLFLDDQIIIAFASGLVTAHDPATGRELWRCKLNGGIRNIPQYTDEFLIFATKSRSLELVSRRTGVRLRRVAADGAIEASPLLLGDYFFLCYTDGRLLRVEAKTGVQRWTDVISHTVVTLTPVTDGRLVLVTSTQGIYAFDPFVRLGGQRWSFPCGDRLQDPVTLDQNRVYVTTRTGRIYCLDLATGKNLWVPSAVVDAGKERKVVEEGLQLPAAPIAAPTVIGDHLLVRMESGLLALYHKHTGALEWLYRITPPVDLAAPTAPLTGAPALDGEKVYFAATDGYIYHLSASAPDIDPPVFSQLLPRNNERGFVNAEGLNYVGAVVHDEGSGLKPATITMKLDGVELTPSMRFDARAGYFYIWLPRETTLAMGMHHLEMTAEDPKGNVGITTQAFIVAPQNSPEIIPITIGGEFLPKTLKVAGGTILKWTNTSGSPRTVICDLVEHEKPLFTSDAQYPEGIPHGGSWVWIVPRDAELDFTYFYHCRLKGAPGNGETLGTGLVGLLQVVEPNFQPEATTTTDDGFKPPVPQNDWVE